MAELLVKVIRGELVESRHRGHLVVTDRSGKEIFSRGNPDHLTYWRSSAKPFQAIPLVERGVVEQFNLSGPEIALFTSSHNGEKQHVETVQGILNKLGLGDNHLDCGTSAPRHLPTAKKMLAEGQPFEVVTNECSGKHSGMLALTLLLEAPLEGYIQRDHPVQQEMLETICNVTGLSKDQIHLGVDGCGVPVFGLPLRNMALAYARFSKPEGYFEPKRQQAIHTIRDAMATHPYYVAGTDRLDTALMEVTQGKVVAKLGSEGVYGVGIVNEGIGLALKIEDGNFRAIDPVVIQVLKQLGYLTDEEFDRLKHLWRPTLRNHRGDEIGHLEVAF